MCIERSRQSGLTLVELILSMVIISIAAVGAMQLMNQSSTASADPIRRKQALLIAESLMEEVRSAQFTFCEPTDPAAPTAASIADCATPEALGAGAASDVRPYDNVNDYYRSGTPFSFNDASGKIIDSGGTAMTRAGYNATVTIDAAILAGATTQLGPSTAPVTSNAAAAGMNALLVTVRVTYGGEAGDYVQLDTYRTRYAPRDF
jgi:MSHA pilin protein MshD